MTWFLCSTSVLSAQGTALDDKSGSLTQIASRLLSGNSSDNLFYVPTFDEPRSPKDHGYAYQSVTIPSTDDAQLHAWFLPARAEVAKGTVIFSHGNSGNIGHHLFAVTWLVDAGYHVLMYDYRGFGKSTGKISRHGLIEDAKAVFAYAQASPKINGKRLIVFGHSMGSAKTIAALAEQRFPGVQAAISYGGFTSYRDMAKVFLGDVGYDLTNDRYSPESCVEKVAPIPLLIVHGTKDEVVPFSQAEKLFARASQPKTFIEVKGGGHGNALSLNDHAYEKKVLKWLDEVMGKSAY